MHGLALVILKIKHSAHSLNANKAPSSALSRGFLASWPGTSCFNYYIAIQYLAKQLSIAMVFHLHNLYVYYLFVGGLVSCILTCVGVLVQE